MPLQACLVSVLAAATVQSTTYMRATIRCPIFSTSFAGSVFHTRAGRATIVPEAGGQDEEFCILLYFQFFSVRESAFPLEGAKSAGVGFFYTPPGGRSFDIAFREVRAC
jgi:hypothetical protein